MGRVSYKSRARFAHAFASAENVCGSARLAMICAVSILLVCVPFAIAQEILQAPESTVVFLDQSAVFTCETVGGDVTTWRVNGILLESLPPEILSDVDVSQTSTPEGTVVEELTIPARAEYNGTRVQCLVGIFGGSTDESENATLRIQGSPSPVVDLTATHNATSITISWEAPWSLDVTGVDHDIWYSVLIQNVTDENNPTPISCTDCTNITETVYTFTPDHLTPCHVYNFSVTPFNGAGQGESRATEHQGISFERKNIKYIDDDMRRVTFNIVCGDSEMINDVTLYYGSNEKAASSISGGEVMFQLPADQEYNTTLGVELSQGGMQNVSTHIFTTFDVQDPQAESHGDNHIGVEGTFIYDSKATGLFLAIQCNITTQITFVALERDGASRRLSEVIEVPPSNYTVYAHDLEEDGLPNPRSANLHPDSLQPITVNGKGDYPKNANPSNASISHTDSSVTIKCTPEEGTSCLVVYRAYGNSTLNTYNKEFPVTITFDHSEPRNYTFAIFRKRNDKSVDRKPFISQMVTVGSVSPPKTGNDEDMETDNETNSSQTQGVVISISMTLVVCALACGAAVLALLVARRYYCHRKQKLAGPNARNVVYDEVVLPPTSSSSSSSTTVIPTEPNAAYATTTRVARHHHSS